MSGGEPQAQKVCYKAGLGFPLGFSPALFLLPLQVQPWVTFRLPQLLLFRPVFLTSLTE